MPPLATTNGFQEIDQKSIQTFVALSDLGLGHARAYQHQTMMSILNVVILGKCKSMRPVSARAVRNCKELTHRVHRARRPPLRQERSRPCGPMERCPPTTRHLLARRSPDREPSWHPQSQWIKSPFCWDGSWTIRSSIRPV